MAKADVPFEGVGVALVTLFHEDGSLDAPSTAALAARLADLGMRAIVVAGSTGEAASLDPDERVALIEAVRAELQSPSRPMLVAGTGAPSAYQAAALTRQARDAGADAVIALSPPRSNDLAAYYERVRESAGDLPVLAYHFPVVSSPGIPVEVLPSLPVDACKDSSGDPGRLLHTLSTCELPLYVGSAALLALAGPLGCAGAILALANAEPERCAAAFAGDTEAQLALASAHRRASERFPSGIKELTAERFGTSIVQRMG
jgi:dihydrodipicolinate synthase/N-acetylneuraminate lyase